MRPRLLIVTALAFVLLTTACAQGDPASPQPSGEPSVTPSFSPFPSGQPSPSASPSPSKPSAGEVTVTGTVEIMDIEGGCKVLRADANKVYEIKGGDPAVLKAGARVTVRGKIRTDVMTICQVGPVLEVISSQPA